MIWLKEINLRVVINGKILLEWYLFFIEFLTIKVKLINIKIKYINFNKQTDR